MYGVEYYALRRRLPLPLKGVLARLQNLRARAHNLLARARDVVHRALAHALELQVTLRDGRRQLRLEARGRRLVHPVGVLERLEQLGLLGVERLRLLGRRLQPARQLDARRLGLGVRLRRRVARRRRRALAFGVQRGMERGVLDLARARFSSRRVASSAAASLAAAAAASCSDCRAAASS